MKRSLWDVVEDQKSDERTPKRPRRSIVEALMPMPAEALSEAALRELQQLRSGTLLDHPRNRRVYTQFSDTLHDYYVDGVCVLGVNRTVEGWKSASGVYHDMFPHFDAKAVATRLQGTDKHKGKTIEEIQAPWNKARLDGSAYHAAIEAFLLGKQTPEALAAPRGFYAFLTKFPHLRFVALEWPVFDADMKLAGCIDAVAFDTLTQKLVIMDWKNCKPASPGANALVDPRQKNTGCHPLTVRDVATKFAQYSIQLNVYATILERVYRLPEKWGMDLGQEFMLVNFPPGEGVFEVYKVPRRTPGPLMDLLPWRDDDPLHIQFEFETKPIIPRLSAEEGEGMDASTRASPQTGPVPANVVWTHSEWKKPKKNAAPGEPGYEYEDSPYKHPWGWMVKDVPEHVGLGYYDAWLRCNEPLLAKLHLLYGKCLPCWCYREAPCKCHTGILRRYAKASGGRSLIPVATNAITALLKSEGSQSPAAPPFSPPASPPSSPLVSFRASKRSPAPFISLDDEDDLQAPPTPSAAPIDVDAPEGPCEALEDLPPPAQDVDALLDLPQMREDEL